MNKTHLPIALLLCCLMASLPSMASGKIRLGFSSSVEASGFFNPQLERITVVKVSPESLAAEAGLLDGDEIIEVNGKPVAGTAAREIEPAFKDIKAGDHLLLKVKRSDGVIAEVDILARE